MAQLLRSPWSDQFESLLAQAAQSLVVCSPFIGRGACDRLIKRVAVGKPSGFHLNVLTDLSRDNMLSAATDVAALSAVVRAIPATTVRFLPSLHAKVYVADERAAVVTSANMTDSGLLRNFEYGVLFSDPNTVRAIRKDVLDYASLGSPIDQAQLEAFASVVADLRGMRQAAEKSLRSQIRQEFDRRLGQMENEILRVRAAGRTAHAIFAEAILRLLQAGPLTTEQIHRAVKRIHPDLCDDNIDRVINGQHFGKKWKHAVRTAQVYLRRGRQIRLENGRWQLVG